MLANTDDEVGRPIRHSGREGAAGQEIRANFQQAINQPVATKGGLISDDVDVWSVQANTMPGPGQQQRGRHEGRLARMAQQNIFARRQNDGGFG
ncbi:hypothetical protein GCM10022276_13140 [Sphingomonas limnosediminicola]|uniref:Uncharacterized protein n=1 Tax=Sphingomonas limnosediminicola TaxID=940133 RepID=A0ABP7L5P4_9SPHN